MLQTFESLLPVFAIILLGALLRRKLVTDPALWVGAEKLGFWVLFPSLLAHVLIEADLRSGQTSIMALTLFLAILGFCALALLCKPVLARFLGTRPPAYSTLFQVAIRWNGFIALAIVDKMYGDTGVSLVAVALAAMVPIINVLNVTVLTIVLSENRPNPWRIAVSVLKNPLIVGCCAGIAINLLSIPIYEPIMTTLDILGRAALGIGLVLVGAGLQVRQALRPSVEVWIGVLVKLVAFPAFVAMLGLMLGLSDDAFAIAIICASVPSAMNGFLLAKEMGGDAPLYAAVVTVQTAVSFLSIPLFLALVG